MMKNARKFLWAALLGCLVVCMACVAGCAPNSALGGLGNGDNSNNKVQYATLTVNVTCNAPSVNFENAQIELTPASGGASVLGTVRNGRLTVEKIPYGNYTAAARIFGLRWQANGNEPIAVQSERVTADVAFETDIIGQEGTIYELHVGTSSFTASSEDLAGNKRATSPATIAIGAVKGEFWLGAKIKMEQRDLRYGNSMGIAFTADTMRYRVVVGHSEKTEPDYDPANPQHTARIGYGVAIRGGQGNLQHLAAMHLYEIEKTSDAYSALIGQGVYMAVHRTAEGNLEVWLGASSATMQKAVDIDHAAYIAHIEASYDNDEIKDALRDVTACGTQDISRIGFRANLETDLPTTVAGLRYGTTMASALADV